MSLAAAGLQVVRAEARIVVLPGDSGEPTGWVNAVPHGAVFGAPMTDAALVEWTYPYAAHNRDDGRLALPASATSPTSFSAKLVPVWPWTTILAFGRTSIRTQVPRSERAPTERRLRATVARSGTTPNPDSTRLSTFSTGSFRRSRN